ncbi:MAG TPA: hypothetical protein QF625_02795 [Candidatus Scalindua sp.]|jgi:hypothetical protein|nr:hypothetical protein [Candidatus Scalindua sp.]|tara:strand:- start:68 stop:238 length:171 start_codon:yes stop_codon:yes gene_type:complete
MIASNEFSVLFQVVWLAVERCVFALEDEGVKVDFIIKKPFDLSVLSGHINDLANIK